MGKPVTFDELDTYMQGDGQPWTSNLWRVRALPTINGYSPSPLMVESLDLPLIQFDVRTKHYGAWSMHFVGGSQIDGFTMSFYVDNKWRSVKYINDWFQSMQHPDTGGFYLPTLYMKVLYVDLYDNLGNLILTSKIDDVWPASMSDPTLSQDGTRLSISVQFKCYWQTLTWV